ncbi:MAG TPA: rod shape-determining protein MreD [Acidimicrobiales bacterium]|nr:rod shape-determining protein MreD [Acidimicrobiales bacterium]
MRGHYVRAGLKVAIVLLIGILLQTSFGADLRVNNIAPDFMLLLAVCAGYVGGPDEGAVVGFAAGLLSDLFLQDTPFGLAALAACLAGFAAGWARTNFLRLRLALVPVIAAAGTALGVVLFIVLGYLVGEAQLIAPGKRWLVEVVVIEATYAAVFALPAVGLMYWALGARGTVPQPLTANAPIAASDGPSRRRAAARSRRRRRVRAKVG